MDVQSEGDGSAWGGIPEASRAAGSQGVAAHGAGRSDPGSPRGALIAWSMLVLCLIAVVSLQQISVWQASQPSPAQESAVTSGEVLPPAFNELNIISRILVKLEQVAPGSASSPMNVSTLDQLSQNPADRLRVAAVVGELVANDSTKAIERLSSLREDLEEKLDEETGSLAEGERQILRTLIRDSRTFELIYAEGPESVSPDAAAELVSRHQWFAELALVHGKPSSDPDRSSLVGGGWAILTVLLAAMLLFGVVCVSGLVVAVLAVVGLVNGKVRFVMRSPAPGGSVYLEMAGVFLLGFLLLQVASELVTSLLPADSATPLWFSLIGQWALLLTLLWPRVRGVSWGRAGSDLGWHRGRGVAREIGCGVLGYLAGVPLFLLAIVMTLIIVLVQQMFEQAGAAPGQGPEPGPPVENPIFDILAGSRGPVLIVLFALMAVWAPLVEESIFRGALFRHMSSRLLWPLAAGLSAVIFAGVHQYPVLLMLPVATLGFNFALMRRWRDSLIAPITAHALHNGTIGVLLITLVWLLR